MTRLNIIKEKLERLKGYDKNYCVFGSIQHRYRLKPVLLKSELEQFEKTNSITLPKEYAEFLLEVGNGGVGPDYGFEGIESEAIRMKFNRLSCKFRFSDSFIPNTYDNCIMDDDELSCEDCDVRFSCVDAYYKDDSEYKYDYISGYLDGTLRINHMGCGMESRIILNGPEFGNVWINDPDQLFTPIHTKSKGRLSFYDWYEDWLDSKLEKFESVKKLFDEKVTYSKIFELPISEFELEGIISTFLGISLIKKNPDRWEASKVFFSELDINLEKEYLRYVKS